MAVIYSNKNYYELLNAVKKSPVENSRSGSVREILGLNVVMPIGLLFYRPGMSRPLGWVEALQVVSGKFDEIDLRKAAPGLLHPYSIHQAYGIKTATQFPKVCSQLINHPETRRAIVHIGQPMDGQEEEKPCVQSYQFMIRNNTLHMFAYVRSWDLISGFIYDTMVMSMVGSVMARILKKRPGNLYVFASSAHIYERDIEAGRLPRAEHHLSHKYFNISSKIHFRDWNMARKWASIILTSFIYDLLPQKITIPSYIEVR